MTTNSIIHLSRIPHKVTFTALVDYGRTDKGRLAFVVVRVEEVK